MSHDGAANRDGALLFGRGSCIVCEPGSKLSTANHQCLLHAKFAKWPFALTELIIDQISLGTGQQSNRNNRVPWGETFTAAAEERSTVTARLWCYTTVLRGASPIFTCIYRGGNDLTP